MLTLLDIPSFVSVGDIDTGRVNVLTLNVSMDDSTLMQKSKSLGNILTYLDLCLCMQHKFFKMLKVSQSPELGVF